MFIQKAIITTNLKQQKVLLTDLYSGEEIQLYFSEFGEGAIIYRKFNIGGGNNNLKLSWTDNSGEHYVIRFSTGDEYKDEIHINLCSYSDDEYHVYVDNIYSSF